MTLTAAQPVADRSARLRRSTRQASLAISAPVAAALAALPFEGLAPPLAGLGLYAAMAWMVPARIERHHRHARFGLANSVTLLRAGGVAVFAALLLQPEMLQGRVAWAVLAAAAGLLALDGVDGWAARRQGLASRFGARFDMEVDAAFILILAILALSLGKAGPWVLGLGLLRYGFVLAGAIVPALRAPLFPSMRRKAVCVVQVAVLTLLLAPPLGPPLSQAMAGAAFAGLLASFAIDLRWLLRRTA